MSPEHKVTSIALLNSLGIPLKCIKEVIVVSKSVPFYVCIFSHASAVMNSPETSDVGVFCNVVHLIIQS